MKKMTAQAEVETEEPTPEPKPEPPPPTEDALMTSSGVPAECDAETFWKIKLIS